MNKPVKRPRDPNQLAKLITDIATGEKPESHLPERQKKASVDNATQKAK